jgi:hypothetical protein
MRLDTRTLVRQHAEAIELLEGIQLHQKRLDSINESLRGYGGLILSVREDFTTKAIREEGLIDMLESRYLDVTNIK